MTQIPHFDLPFRYSGGVAVTVEQDSLDDLANCVEAALRCPVGFRPMVPTFGIPEQTFLQQPLSAEDLIRRITEWEERVHLGIQADPDRFDELISRVLVDVSGRVL